MRHLKTMKLIPTIAFMILMVLHASAQKPVIVALSEETNGVQLNTVQLSSLLRTELEKTDKYQVVDKYDMISLMKKAHISPDSCLGKTCLVTAGKAMNADKVLIGNFNKYGQKLSLELVLVDVKTSAIEKTQVDEYLDLQQNVQDMVSVSVRKLAGLDNDELLVRKLTKKDDYESEVNNPEGVEKLVLSGPRTGVAMLTGKDAARFRAPKSNGGYAASPYMFVFGYQKEIQYINSGKMQALFEFVPAISGVDKGLFIPSVACMNGLRNNVNGWEFAIGATFSIVTASTGYYNADGSWISNTSSGFDSNHPTEQRIDANGSAHLSTGFIFAVGKSFKSGRMNIPLNAYAIPGKDGWRIGLSFGFNAKSNRKVEEMKAKKVNGYYE